MPSNSHEVARATWAVLEGGGSYSLDQLQLLTDEPAVSILRYLGIARSGSRAETPERLLLTDRMIQLDLVVWAGLFAYVLYGETGL